jgi:hypothetical protein
VDLLRDAGIPVRRPRTPAEASKWNFEAANVFLAHLASRDFNYTLNIERIQRSAQNDARDPVERFLLVDRIGHCEFFAASFVALCHVVDIDTTL